MFYEALLRKEHSQERWCASVQASLNCNCGTRHGRQLQLCAFALLFSAVLGHILIVVKHSCTSLLKHFWEKNHINSLFCLQKPFICLNDYARNASVLKSTLCENIYDNNLHLIGLFQWKEWKKEGKQRQKRRTERRKGEETKKERKRKEKKRRIKKRLQFVFIHPLQ